MKYILTIIALCLAVRGAVHADTLYSVQIKYTDVTRDDIRAIADTGFTAVRVGVRKALIAPHDRAEDWSRLDAIVASAAANHLTVLMTLMDGDYASPRVVPPRTELERARFASFATQAASRYRGRATLWFEIWNEPDNPRYWDGRPNASEYRALVEAVCRSMRAGDPEVPLYAGATAFPDSGHARRIFKALLPLVRADCISGISFHPYRQSSPDTLRGDITVLRKDFGDVPLIVSEWGYTRKADRFRQSFHGDDVAGIPTVGAALHLPLVSIYEWRNSGRNAFARESNFGLVTLDRSPTAALGAVRTALRALTSSKTDSARR